MNLELVFGAVCHPISEQVKTLGLRIDDQLAERFQLDADAITRLSVRGLIPDFQIKLARKRLIKEVASNCRI